MEYTKVWNLHSKDCKRSWTISRKLWLHFILRSHFKVCNKKSELCFCNILVFSHHIYFDCIAVCTKASGALLPATAVLCKKMSFYLILQTSLENTSQGGKSKKSIWQPTRWTEYLYIVGTLRVSGIRISELLSKNCGQIAVSGHKVHSIIGISWKTYHLKVVPLRKVITQSVKFSYFPLALRSNFQKLFKTLWKIFLALSTTVL